MKQITIYKYGFIGMVIFNLILLGMVTTQIGKPPHPKGPPNGRNDFLAKASDIMNLDKEQIKKFETLASEHNEDIKTIQTQQKELIRKYFQGVINKNTNVDSSVLDKVKNLEGDKIAVTYDHFDDVYKILNESQRSNFRKFVEAASGIILLKN